MCNTFGATNLGLISNLLTVVCKFKSQAFMQRKTHIIIIMYWIKQSQYILLLIIFTTSSRINFFTHLSQVKFLNFQFIFNSRLIAHKICLLVYTCNACFSKHVFSLHSDLSHETKIATLCHSANNFVSFVYLTIRHTHSLTHRHTHTHTHANI